MLTFLGFSLLRLSLITCPASEKRHALRATSRLLHLDAFSLPSHAPIPLYRSQSLFANGMDISRLIAVQLTVYWWFTKPSPLLWTLQTVLTIHTSDTLNTYPSYKIRYIGNSDISGCRVAEQGTALPDAQYLKVIVLLMIPIILFRHSY